MKWKGVWVALVTPFQKGEVDIQGVKRLVDRFLEAGIQGISPSGTTGEGSSLSDQEFQLIVETVLEQTKGKVFVLPGTGSNSTQKTIERTSLAKKLGAHGALVVTPYYVKPTQEGMRRHFSFLSEKVDLPLMLYNVPGRTAVNLLPETVEKIIKESHIGGIKECASLPQFADLLERVGNSISVFSGEDGVFLPVLSLGAHGIISVTANVIPDRFVSIYDHFQKGSLREAQKEFLGLTRLIEMLFIETNPIPVKAGLEMLGLISKEVRCPLSEISEKNEKLLRETMVQVGILRL